MRLLTAMLVMCMSDYKLACLGRPVAVAYNHEKGSDNVLAKVRMPFGV